MTVGSLFSGCLGLDLGLEAAGWETVWACENDEACRRVIAERRPGLPVVEDVRLVDEGAPRVDLLAGGFPCQDLSYAGKGAGLDGDRSGLWFEFARTVRVLRPRFVLVENVPGLVTRGLGRVLFDLADAGYVGSWIRLGARDVGAPHRRDRIFILATADAECVRIDADGGVLGGGTREPNGPGEPSLSPGSQVARAADALADRRGSAPDSGSERSHGSGERNARGAARETRDGRIVAPRSAEDAPDADRLGREESGRSAESAATGGRVATPDSADDGRGGVGSAYDDDGSNALRNESDGRDADHREWGPYGAAVARWERILGRTAPAPTDERGRLNPPFVEWMLGFPGGWTESEKRTSRLRMLGNAVQVQCGQYVGEILADAARG